MGRILAFKERMAMAQQVVAKPLSVSAPIKGWNTRDALDAMDPLDAVQLDNFYPDAGGVNVRNGFLSYATGVGSGPVKTLVEYNAGATRKFLAAASGKIYDVSAAGTPGAPLATGFSSDQWQTVSFLSRTFFANGADTMQIYDGSTVANSTFTGVTLSTLVGGVIYQQRLFFWAVNSTGFWYAPLNSINGALAFYDLAAFCPHGGNLIAATTFSHDGGNGVLDFIAFMMSSGDCLLYFGNDPSSAVSWQLIGIYRISPPVNVRAVCNYGADAFITTFDDHVPLEQQLTALQQGKLPPRSKVSNAVQAAVTANGSAFGWQALYYPKGRRLIFNIPNPDGSFDQHVQNTGSSYSDPATGQAASPWCRFRNMPAYCWGLFKDTLYFGAPGGIIYQADVGNLDLLGTINAVGQQAWNTFQNPLRKRMSAVRPVVQSVGVSGFNFSLGFDYGDINVPDAAVVAVSGSPWDVSPWDVSPWSPEFVVSKAWHASGGSGVAVGLAMNIAGNSASTWLRNDFRFEQGDAL